MAEEVEDYNEDPFVLAGAYVLGALDGVELSTAKRMQLSDPEFRSAMEWWERRLGSMAEAAGEFSPSPDLLRGIEARIDRIEASDTYGDGAHANISPPKARPAGWSIASALAGAGMAAAAIAIYVSTPSTVQQPAPTIAQAPAPQLVAQLQDDSTGRRLVGRYDSTSRRFALSIEGFEAEAGKAPELWVIPEGGAPVSLGAIPETGTIQRELNTREAGLVREGSTIAVTFENDIGEPHQAPTPPILVAGLLDRI